MCEYIPIYGPFDWIDGQDFLIGGGSANFGVNAHIKEPGNGIITCGGVGDVIEGDGSSI